MLASGSEAAHRDDAKDYKILLDSPSEHAALRFDEYSRGLAEIIQQSIPRFAIGIFGGWGSGKTTLMQSVKRLLNPDSVIAVEFNAWRYEKEDHLIVPLLDSVRDALSGWKSSNASAKDQALKTAMVVGRAARALMGGLKFKIGLPSAAEVAFDVADVVKAAQAAHADADNGPASAYYAAFADLRKAFADFVGPDKARRIVVFIDDLDRCLPSGALQVMESMKLFFDLDGFVFVVGLDRRPIEWSIESRYREYGPGPDRTLEDLAVETSDYVNKIFQIEFTLYPIASVSLDPFINSLVLDNQLPEAQAQDLRNRVLPHLRYLFTKSGINPRRLKQYVNAYTVQLKLNPGLDRDVLLALQTIDRRKDWALINKAIHIEKELFTDAVRHAEGDPGALADVYPEYSPLPKDFGQYIALGAPGRRLLEVPSLQEYVQSGESISGGQAIDLRFLAQTIAQLHPLLRKVDARFPARKNLPAVQRLMRDVEYIREQLAGSAINSQAVDALEAKVLEFMELTPPFEDSELRAWQHEMHTLIRQASETVGQMPPKAYTVSPHVEP